MNNKGYTQRLLTFVLTIAMSVMGLLSPMPTFADEGEGENIELVDVPTNDDAEHNDEQEEQRQDPALGQDEDKPAVKEDGQDVPSRDESVAQQNAPPAGSEPKSDQGETDQPAGTVSDIRNTLGLIGAVTSEKVGIALLRNVLQPEGVDSSEGGLQVGDVVYDDEGNAWVITARPDDGSDEGETINNLADALRLGFQAVPEDEYSDGDQSDGETVSIPVKKVWDDEGAESVRPDSVVVNFGYSTFNWSTARSEYTVVSTTTLDAAHGWEGEFSGVPADYAEDGYDYIVWEEPLRRDYDESWTNEGFASWYPTIPTHTASVTGDAASGYVVTNRPWWPNITIENLWVGDDEGDRPGSLTFDLLADGVKVDEITLTQEDLYSGNKYDNSGNLIEGTLWSRRDATQTPHPLYDENGDFIEYSIAPHGVSGYTVSPLFKSFDPKNLIWTLTAESVVSDNIDIPVKKVWDDNGNEYGNRPDEVVLELHEWDNARGVATDPVATLTVTDDGDGDDEWPATFEDVPAHDENGDAIRYFITEQETDYYSARSEEYDGTSPVTLTNRPCVMARYEVVKIWEDDGDKESRPNVTFTLSDEQGTIDTLTLTPEDEMSESQAASLGLDANDVWIGAFSTEVPCAVNRQEVEYTITETPVDGYDTTKGDITHSQKGNTVRQTFINTKTDEEVVDIPVEKVWNDNDDEFNNRPETLTYHLYASVDRISDTEPVPVDTVVALKENNYAATFEDKPVCDADGNRILYFVGEDPIVGYAPVIGYTDLTKRFGYYTFDDQQEFNGTDPVVIRNDQNAPLHLSVYKVWDDDGYEGSRPESITLGLYEVGGDEPIDELTLSASDAISEESLNNIRTMDAEHLQTVPDYTKIAALLPDSAEDVWIGNFTFHPPFAKDGALVSCDTYEIREIGADGYEADISEWFAASFKNFYKSAVITNTRKPEETPEPMRKIVKVSKVWNDEGNEDKRPESITIRLFAGDEEVASAELSEDTGWACEFADLAVLDEGGEQIDYEVSEDEVEGYSCVIEGNESDDGLEKSFYVENTLIEVPEVPEEPETPEEPAQPISNVSSPKNPVKTIRDLVPTGDAAAMTAGLVVATAACGAFIAWKRRH